MDDNDSGLLSKHNIKRALIVCVALLSVAIFIGSKFNVTTLCVLILAWFFGAWFAKYTGFWVEWSSSQKPLKQFIDERRINAEPIITSPKVYARHPLEQPEAISSLTKVESEAWQNLVKTLSED
jgi:hypothetical protein